MIEIILFTAGCVGGLVLGYVFGHSRGYKACANVRPIPLEPPCQPTLFPCVETRPTRFDCSWRIPNAEKPEDRIRFATEAARCISEKIARELLAKRVIRPVIIESSDASGRTIEIGASIYAIANPTLNDYPPLVFFQPENT